MWFRRRLRVVAGMVALMAPAPFAAADAADAARGEALAKQWCASCHLVGAVDAGVRSDTPPSFASVARRPDTSDSALRAWLGVPHPSMPNLDLSRADTEDLVAYIRSLAPHNR